MCRTRFHNRRIDPKISSNRQTDKELHEETEKIKCQVPVAEQYLVQQLVEVATKSSLC